MPDRPAATYQDRVRALALLRRWGWNVTGFQVLETGFSHYFDADDACVAYVDTGSAWVAAGAPIAPLSRLSSVSRNFVSAARAAGRRACFFAVEQRFVDASGFPFLPLGEQASFDPRRWSADLSANRSLRAQLQRARAKGVRVRAASLRDYASADRRAVESLIERWLGSRAMPAMRFLVDVQPFGFPEERRYFVAERAGEVVGFLGAVPVYARRGWLFEDLLRAPEAPNGTTELLVDAAMRAVCAEGSSYVTLGLAPLSGGVPTWMRGVGRLATPLYNFEGLHAFKAKFSPHAWDAILLSHAPGASASLSLYDALTAFAGGNILEFGFRTLLRAIVKLPDAVRPPIARAV